MKVRYTAAFGLMGLLAAGATFAQGATPPASPGAQPSDPSAASSPHQRAATKSPSDETPAATSGSSPSDAATPNQKQTMKKKHNKKKAATPSSSTPDTSQ